MKNESYKYRLGDGVIQLESIEEGGMRFTIKKLNGAGATFELKKGTPVIGVLQAFERLGGEGIRQITGDDLKNLRESVSSSKLELDKSLAEVKVLKSKLENLPWIVKKIWVK